MADPISVKWVNNALIHFVEPSIVDQNFANAKAAGKRHYAGLTCSWHGYHDKPWCPKCGGMMQPMPESVFWQSVIAMDSSLNRKGAWVDVCKWTDEKCFPDFETMLQVYNSVRGTKFKPQDFVPF